MICITTFLEQNKQIMHAYTITTSNEYMRFEIKLHAKPCYYFDANRRQPHSLTPTTHACTNTDQRDNIKSQVYVFLYN